MATDRSKWWVFRLPEWLQCMARGHHRLVHVENIYGDEILLLGCRSIWKCEHCGFHFRKSNLAAASEPLTCWGLRSFCAEVGHKCRAAGKCVFAPPPTNAAGVGAPSAEAQPSGNSAKGAPQQ